MLSTQGRDGRQWREYVDALPAEKRDVYFLPEYAAMYEGVSGEPAFLFRFGDRSEGVLMVAVMKSVSELSFHGYRDRSSDAPNYFDISSPYGYGGPVAHCPGGQNEAELFAAFREALHDHCESNHIVTEFLRLHPLMENHQFFGTADELYEKNSTVWIDLRQTEQEIFQTMRKDHRRNIGKAQRKGVEITRTEVDSKHLRQFHQLYTATMERLNALPMYFFPYEFIEEAAAGLNGNISCFFATCNGIVVSAHLVLHYGVYVHNFLSGSDSAHWNLKPDVLITYEVARWARSEGYQYFHLGGGHGFEEDSLFHFKSGFSSNRSPYYMYRQIHDQQAYRTLCRVKSEFDKMNAGEGSGFPPINPVMADYFPAYRA